MNIIINAFSARLGGGQTYLINLLNNLPVDQDVKIGVFAPESLVLPEDSRIRRLRTLWPTTNPLLRVVWEKLILPFTLMQLRADILFCPGGLLNTRVMHSCRTVTMFRNMIPFDPVVRANLPFGRQRVRNWLLERAMLRSMKSANLTIFISDYARSVIQALTTIRNPVTIPHGISDAFRTYNQDLLRPDVVPEDNYLLYVSRFDVYKHHYEIVSAYSKLPSRVRDKYKLFLVGENDMPEGGRVREFIEAHGLRDRVILAGAFKYAALPAVYKHASLIIFASSCENCPNILLESLGAGRPVLSSSVMPMPEFGGDSILYFDPRNPDDLAIKIDLVLSDPLQIERLSVSSAKKSEFYSWESTATSTWKAMCNL